MIVKDEIINSLLQEIDHMSKNGIISLSDADDLTTTITWIIGKTLNESNVDHVVNQLRGFKHFMNETSVSIIIKNFKKICGEYM